MQATTSGPAFAGTTVVSTRKESAIEGAIVRRRLAPDGRRFTTYEIDESKAELLLSMPGGLVRRHTAINPENIAKAVELANAGTPRKEAEQLLGVSAGTYRRLLAAGGATMRRYTPVLTDENVLRALKISVKYDIRKRGDIIKASKELGVDSRTLRRLIQKGLDMYTIEQITGIRTEERERLATPEGQAELNAAKAPLPRKPKTKKVALEQAAVVAPPAAPVEPLVAEPAAVVEAATPLVAVVAPEVVVPSDNVSPEAGNGQAQQAEPVDAQG